MKRSWALVVVLSAGMLAGPVRAAEVPMPDETEVARAVGEQIDGTDVCVAPKHLPGFDEDGHAVLANTQAYSGPDTRRQIDTLVRLKYATTGEQPNTNGTPWQTLTLTEAGREVFGWNVGRPGRLCYAKRKLHDIALYTPPVERGGFWIVRVVYHWVAVEPTAWSKPLLEAGLLDRDAGTIAAPRRASAALVLTQRGWKDESWFGYPTATKD